MRHTFALILLLTAIGAGAEHHTLQDKIMAAMASDARSEADIARDRNRKPVETLAFFQMRDDMSVLELLPGGGLFRWRCQHRGLLLDRHHLFESVALEDVLAELTDQTQSA